MINRILTWIGANFWRFVAGVVLILAVLLVFAVTLGWATDGAFYAWFAGVFGQLVGGGND